jgi:o-succinylbenzoate synthase
MRIERVEVIPYALRFAKRYQTARGHLDRRELALVRLHADGATGIGEAAPLALRGGAVLGEIVSHLERCGEALVGTEITSTVDAQLAACAGAAPQARLAVEVATLDLIGQLTGRSLGELLGGAPARPVECNATLSTGPPEVVAARALEWAALGFRTFKLKVGVTGDVDQVRAARTALGDEAHIRVDANGCWSVEEACERLAAMGAVEIAEQPVATLTEMAALKQRTDVRLAADEIVTDVAGAEAARGACDAVTVKLAKVGSIAESRAIAKTMPVYLSSALDGPVGIAAAAHVAQALPPVSFAHGLATSLLFADTIAGRECNLADGRLHVPPGAGLGVRIDEAALARCRIDV